MWWTWVWPQMHKHLFVISKYPLKCSWWSLQFQTFGLLSVFVQLDLSDPVWLVPAPLRFPLFSTRSSSFLNRCCFTKHNYTTQLFSFFLTFGLISSIRNLLIQPPSCFCVFTFKDFRFNFPQQQINQSGFWELSLNLLIFTPPSPPASIPLFLSSSFHISLDSCVVVFFILLCSQRHYVFDELIWFSWSNVKGQRRCDLR